MDEKASDEHVPVRRSIRLAGHNYAWTASYFITIRGAHHEPVFEIQELHTILHEVWMALPQRFPHVQLDEFVVMPDHIHGILHFHVTDKTTQSLGRVIGAYKSLTTVTWFDYVKTHTISWSGSLWQRNYHEHVLRDTTSLMHRSMVPSWRWQRNYHEHVLRDTEDLAQKRRYIRENPRRWAAHPNRYT